MISLPATLKGMEENTRRKGKTRGIKQMMPQSVIGHKDGYYFVIDDGRLDDQEMRRKRKRRRKLKCESGKR